MIPQTLFDAVADDLVAKGREVTYTNVQAELNKLRGKGTSDRDLKLPKHDWMKRRKYKAHFALLDLPEDMEKLVAQFAEAAMRKAKIAEAEIARLQKQAAELQRENGEIRERCRLLTEEVMALRAAPAPVVPPLAQEVVRPRGRKVGISGATARFFWNRVMEELALLIERQGPQHLDELLASIGPKERALAAAAFRPLDAGVLRKALSERILRQRHGLTVLPDGRYAVLR